MNIFTDLPMATAAILFFGGLLWLAATVLGRNHSVFRFRFGRRILVGLVVMVAGALGMVCRLLDVLTAFVQSLDASVRPVAFWLILFLLVAIPLAMALAVYVLWSDRKAKS